MSSENLQSIDMPDKNNSITIKEWNEIQFRDSKIEWTQLLNKSNSDKLFMSWEWQYTWWDIFAAHNKLKLTLLAAYNENQMLVGLAPLFLIKARTKKLIKTTQLQFIGNIWRGEDTMRTEYLDFIVSPENSLSIKKTFLRYINNNITWDEFYFSDLNKSSSTHDLITKKNILTNVYTRTMEEYKSYYLDTSKEFNNYLSERGKNTRSNLYNKRKKLESKGEVKVTKSSINQIEEHFTLLNTLHKKRWGKSVFNDKTLKFNTQLAKKMAERNALNFSVMSINEQPLSIQLNYIVNQYEYNIQGGFDEIFDKRLALGYLHTGYEIERAFKNEILIFDFLAGEGKNTQYKERLTNTYHNITQLQIIKKNSLKTLYAIKDFLTKL